MNKKKIAIVGLGKIGLFHLSILRNLPNVSIAALSDPKSSARCTVKGMGIESPFFDSVERMLDQVPLDGIFACIPPAFNRRIAESCAAKGISLFLEKPMAANLADARAILECARKSPRKITTAVGYMVAYFPLFQKAKNLIKEGAIGEIKSYSSRMLLGEVFQKQVGWRQDPKISGGGAVSVLGSHLLYLLKFFFDMPKSITFSSGERVHSQKVEDEATVTFNHGTFDGKFQVSWSEKGYSDMLIEIEVYGNDGVLTVTDSSLVLNGPQSRVWYPWDFPERNSSPVQIAQQGYIAQDEDFISAIGTERDVRVNWDQGLDVQIMIDGIYSKWK